MGCPYKKGLYSQTSFRYGLLKSHPPVVRNLRELYIKELFVGTGDSKRGCGSRRVLECQIAPRQEESHKNLR
jgi:hypothetical protein